MLEVLTVIALLCTVNSGGMESSIRRKTSRMQRECQQEFQKCIEKKEKVTVWKVLASLSTLRGLIGIP